MKFVDLPSPNYFEDKTPVQAVVLHGTSGPLQASINWLRNPQPENPDNAVSANFVISKAGVIYRLVDFERGRRAWANGRVETFDASIPWLAAAVAAKKNPNRCTVSIEHEATAQEMSRQASMPVAQFNASIDLTAYILRACGLKANVWTVIGHYHISGRQKANCPGVIFPSAYIEIVQDRYKGLK